MFCPVSIAFENDSNTPLLWFAHDQLLIMNNILLNFSNPRALHLMQRPSLCRIATHAMNDNIINMHPPNVTHMTTMHYASHRKHVNHHRTMIRLRIPMQHVSRYIVLHNVRFRIIHRFKHRYWHTSESCIHICC